MHPFASSGGWPRALASGPRQQPQCWLSFCPQLLTPDLSLSLIQGLCDSTGSPPASPNGLASQKPYLIHICKVPTPRNIVTGPINRKWALEPALPITLDLPSLCSKNDINAGFWRCGEQSTQLGSTDALSVISMHAGVLGFISGMLMCHGRAPADLQ